MDGLVHDLRYALRGLRRRGAFTAAAVATLALGIGANTSIFSVIEGVLLEPLPFADADRLAMVWLDNTRLGLRTDITSYPNYLDWREGSRSFEDLAAYSNGGANLTGDFEPERVTFAETTANFFRVLGVSPARGRAFSEEETQGEGARVVVISHALWQRRFGGDPATVGRSVELNDTEYNVIGVTPQGFAFPGAVDLWSPLAPSEGLREARGAFWLHVVGRLASGATVREAQTEMSGIAARINDAFPRFEGYGIYVQPIRDHLIGGVRPALLVLLGAVGFLLLIACANVANLLLARAISRERELAVRSALGAGRGRIARQFLTEAVLIAVIGGGLALPIAFWGVDLLKAIAPPDLPRMDLVSVNPTVLAFTLGISLLTGIICGLIPALRASGVPLAAALREGARGLSAGRGDQRVRSALIVGEVALALVLLIGAGLLIRSFAQLRGVDSGFEPDNVFTARISLSGSRYDDAPNRVRFWEGVLERVEGLPGVESAAAGSEILLPQLPWSGGVSIEGKPRPPAAERIEVTVDAVTPDFFRAVGTRLLRGRDFSEEDDPEATPVVTINQAMADRYWPGEDPIGKRFKWGDPDNDSPWRTVVGVVANARRTGQEREARPSGYLPLRQLPVREMVLVVRASRDPMLLAGPVRDAVRSVDASVPIAELATLDALLGQRLARRQLTTLLVGLFSALALALAAIGVYGVISYAVTQSRQEIGIRLALGAVRSDVFSLVLRRIGTLVAAGLGLGLGVALLATRALSGLLYGVTTTDPITFVAVPALLTATALVAGFIPARRATRVDPMVALRQAE